MARLEKAQLIELKQDFVTPAKAGNDVVVQFNPEALKVTFANQIVQPSGGDQAAGNTGRQFVGAGTTKLALMLWFDVTAMTQDAVDDVRRLTQKVIYFMTPTDDVKDKKRKVPPALRFSWGSFLFDGMVDGLEESLEFFSPEGKPLRASISLTLTQQKILVSKFEGTGNVPSRPGHSPLSAAQGGGSLQGMAAGAGVSNWQAVASANGIEDPLRLAPGQLVDLSLGAEVSGGASASIGLSIAPPRVQLSTSFGVN